MRKNSRLSLLVSSVVFLLSYAAGATANQKSDPINNSTKHYHPRTSVQLQQKKRASQPAASAASSASQPQAQAAPAKASR